MNCEEILAAMNEYVDGQRGSAICAALEEHLAHCNPCQIVVDNIRQTITLYKSGEPFEMPTELQDRLRGLLRDRWRVRFSGKGE
jgi:predicted anti-sigma-YlaC factor YlaD